MKTLAILTTALLAACATAPQVAPLPAPQSCTAPALNYLPSNATLCSCVGQEQWVCKVTNEYTNDQIV